MEPSTDIAVVHQLRKQLATAAENFRGTWAALGAANDECERLKIEIDRLRQDRAIMLSALHKVRAARDIHDEPGDEAWDGVISAILAVGA